MTQEWSWICLKLERMWEGGVGKLVRMYKAPSEVAVIFYFTLLHHRTFFNIQVLVSQTGSTPDPNIICLPMSKSNYTHTVVLKVFKHLREQFTQK